MISDCEEFIYLKQKNVQDLIIYWKDNTVPWYTERLSFLTWIAQASVCTRAHTMAWVWMSGGSAVISTGQTSEEANARGGHQHWKGWHSWGSDWQQWLALGTCCSWLFSEGVRICGTIDGICSLSGLVSVNPPISPLPWPCYVLTPTLCLPLCPQLGWRFCGMGES